MDRNSDENIEASQTRIRVLEMRVNSLEFALAESSCISDSSELRDFHKTLAYEINSCNTTIKNEKTRLKNLLKR